jgi:hypothetical protein
MVVTDFLFALVVTFVIFLIFSRGFQRTGPFAGVVWFFLMILFASWAGGVWVRPIGPALWGVYWVPFVMVGLLVALLLFASTPTQPFVKPPRPLDDQAEAEVEAEVLGATLGASFWVMLIFLVIAIAAHYITRPTS